MEIQEYEGKRVTVWIGNDIRNSFDTAMSIAGILEMKDDNHFRIVISEATYVYFRKIDVVKLIQPDGFNSNEVGMFKDGSLVVVKIVI